MQVYSSDDIEALRSELAKWQGAWARVVHLTSSHRELQIDLWRPGAPTQFTVVCIGPIYFSGALTWGSASLRVRPASDPAEAGGRSAAYDIFDEGAKVLVRCSSVHAIETPDGGTGLGSAVGGGPRVSA